MEVTRWLRLHDEVMGRYREGEFPSLQAARDEWARTLAAGVAAAAAFDQENAEFLERIGPCVSQDQVASLSRTVATAQRTGQVEPLATDSALGFCLLLAVDPAESSV